MSPIIISERCPYCQKGRSPAEIIPLGDGGAKICTDCYAQHEAALLALSGLKANSDGTFSTDAPPPMECSECHRTPQQLKESGWGGDRFTVIYENGVYRYFCTPCADIYETKRRELFAGTQYAQERGL